MPDCIVRIIQNIDMKGTHTFPPNQESQLPPETDREYVVCAFGTFLNDGFFFVPAPGTAIMMLVIW
jgi:hypothetical protein